MTKDPLWQEIIPELKTAWRFAWKKTQTHYKSLIPCSLLYGCTIFAGDLSSFVIDKKSDAYFVIALTGAMLGMIFNIGLIRIGFELEAGKKPNPWLLFGYGRFILPLIALNLLIGGPLLLFLLFVLAEASYASPLVVAAAVYYFVRLGLFSYFLAESGPSRQSLKQSSLALTSSLKQSFVITRGWFSLLLVLMICEFVLLLGAAALLGIGLIWAVPFTLFANIYVFRRIIERSLVK